MAQKVRWKILADGRSVGVREDGSVFVKDPQTGQKTEISGPDEDMAFAFNDTSTLDDSIAASTAWQNSPAGQRADQLYKDAYDRSSSQFDQQQQTREDAQDTNQYTAETGRQNADTNQYTAETGRLTQGTSQYSAETGRMTATANISELERRFGLDLAKYGTEYVKTAIEYAKTPRKWIDSIMWEGGATPIYQALTGGGTNPAYGAKGAATGMPGMNNIGDTMGKLGYDAGSLPFDPTKALQQVIKAVPPGQSPAGQMSDSELAVINLAKSLYQQGGANVSEGAWESTSPDAQQGLLGAMDWLAPGGGDRYLQNIAKTRMPKTANVLAA